MIDIGVQRLLRAAAAKLVNLADRADDFQTDIDPDWAAQPFAGVDFVGIDFSTSIRSVAPHVIRGWDCYLAQMDALRPDHGVWAFGVNWLPFPLTRRPVSPDKLPHFRDDHFQRQGQGCGLVEHGSAFYDYVRVAVEFAQELSRAAVPVTVSLMCDGFPNGGLYHADEVRPQVLAAREEGVRFQLKLFMQAQHWRHVRRFSDSLGLSYDCLEVVNYDGDSPDGDSVCGSFASLSRF